MRADGGHDPESTGPICKILLCRRSPFFRHLFFVFQDHHHHTKYFFFFFLLNFGQTN